MADNKKNVKSDVAGDPGAAAPFNWAEILPEGYSTKDMRKVGGLTPIYATEAAFDEKWPPCVGKLAGVKPIFFKDEPDPNKAWRDFLVIKADLKTRALKGTAKEQVPCDIEVGDYMLCPVNGSLKNIKEIMIAANDPDQVWSVAIRALGWKDIGRAKGQEMMEMEAFLFANPIPRKGEFALIQAGEGERPAALPSANGGVTHTGQVYDRDGVLQNVATAPAAS